MRSILIADAPYPLRFFAIVITNIISVSALLLLPIASVAKSPENYWEEGNESAWVQGATSKLRIITTKAPEYDGDQGAVRIEIRIDGGKKKAKTLSLSPGIWLCLAYSRPAKAFVLGRVLQKGRAQPVVRLEYLDEGAWMIRNSKNSSNWDSEGYDNKKDNHFSALAAVPSPDGRYIAMIGDFKSESGKLMALDSVLDSLEVLGEPPAPPPGSATGVNKESGFDWHGGGPSDGFLNMDPGILVFKSTDTLRASYGNDTSKARASDRRIKEWNLHELFSP